MNTRGANGKRHGRMADRRRRILVLDDHPIVRYGLTRLIDGEPDLMTCGEATDGRQALSVITATSPDLVVADIAMPGLGIFEFIKRVRASWPRVSILILSNYDESLYAERMVQAGAQGYVMKREGGGTLLAAIRHVLQGHLYLSPAMTDAACGVLGQPRRARKGRSTMPQISDREFEVLRCFSGGKTTREVAAELGISAKTVETHRLSLCRKLDLKSAAELIRFAVRWEESGAAGIPSAPVPPADSEHSAE